MGMRMATVASHVGDVLIEEFGDPIRAIGWYDADAGERYDTVYVSPETRASSVDAGQILDGCLLESLGRDYHDSAHDEPLRATLRLYDSMIDVDLPVSYQSGIVVLLGQEDIELASDVISLARTVSSVEIGVKP